MIYVAISVVYCFRFEKNIEKLFKKNFFLAELSGGTQLLLQNFTFPQLFGKKMVTL